MSQQDEPAVGVIPALVEPPRRKGGRPRLPEGERKDYRYSLRADDEYRKIVTKLRRHFGFDSESEVIREGVFLLEQKVAGSGESSELPRLRQIHAALGAAIRRAAQPRSVKPRPQSQLGLFELTREPTDR